MGGRWQSLFLIATTRGHQFCTWTRGRNELLLDPGRDIHVLAPSPMAIATAGVQSDFNAWTIASFLSGEISPLSWHFAQALSSLIREGRTARCGIAIIFDLPGGTYTHYELTT